MALLLAGFLARPEEMSYMNSVKTNGFTMEGEKDMGMPSLAVHWSKGTIFIFVSVILSVFWLDFSWLGGASGT